MRFHLAGRHYDESFVDQRHIAYAMTRWNFIDEILSLSWQESNSLSLSYSIIFEPQIRCVIHGYSNYINLSLIIRR